MTNNEIVILVLMFAIFWLMMSATSIANIYWLMSENKKREKDIESQKTE